jgi:hypothetical protein
MRRATRRCVGLLGLLPLAIVGDALAGRLAPVQGTAAGTTGWWCVEITPERGLTTSLCKRTREECDDALRTEAGAGTTNATTCTRRRLAYCMSYEYTRDADAVTHTMCMGTRAGCEGLRRVARAEGRSAVRACVPTR